MTTEERIEKDGEVYADGEERRGTTAHFCKKFGYIAGATAEHERFEFVVNGLKYYYEQQLKQERNKAIDLFKEVLTTLQSKEIEYRECSVESNPNWEYFKGKADAYEFAVKQLKRVFEWQGLTAHGEH